MKIIFSATNALNKWLKADLSRLPTPQGKQAGVNMLQSNEQQFSWQVHIIDNRYKSCQKTIIACEANSRFIVFIPVSSSLTLEELTQRLMMQWQYVLAETLASQKAILSVMPRSDIACLLSDLSELKFNISWVKNTDLSISGHTTDAGQWITHTIRDRNLGSLPSELILDLAIYLNTQTKRITNKETKRKEKFVPVERLLAYCTESLAVRSVHY